MRGRSFVLNKYEAVGVDQSSERCRRLAVLTKIIHQWCWCRPTMDLMRCHRLAVLTKIIHQWCWCRLTMDLMRCRRLAVLTKIIHQWCRCRPTMDLMPNLTYVVSSWN
ncbi:hypothetical protein BDA96_02G156900 [Sorghum bicolor]|uniref:Uncharacterized protein n=2 Tax=Sorghum bicolor TaxID=4558 RepID=A0A1W0W417_SORBI|nr:hypothetical protein BDA96_02G156900 [Sorghum bicolor]OQU89133.1 hypothetical protein SORBI_3002G150766 [Sorghum bicolor]OQU89134.1 hypothetical protein SORBI_3002G150766 [Sorghum bicolor]OQU89135.1 hypothetical protein SORBI_3002G150766 [Sorghum bicolor]OQU89136.1 hypothetical protein SORBI_3002G150766 [Sorghum bicolor]